LRGNCELTLNESLRNDRERSSNDKLKQVGKCILKGHETEKCEENRGRKITMRSLTRSVTATRIGVACYHRYVSCIILEFNLLAPEQQVLSQILKFILILMLVDKMLEELLLNFITTLSQRLSVPCRLSLLIFEFRPKISVPYALERKVLDIKEANSIELSLSSCAKEEISL
jgi:hypothetical protein